MKVILLYIIALLSTLLVLLIFPESPNQYSEITNSYEQDEYFINSELSTLSLSEKNLVYEYQLDFIKSFDQVNYISPSTSLHNFSRDWSFNRMLDYEKQPLYDLNGYLLSNDNETYYFLVSLVKHTNNFTGQEHFIRIDHSSDFNYTLIDQKLTYTYKSDKTLLYENDIVTNDLDYLKISIPNYTHFMRNPLMTLSFLFKIDNPSELINFRVDFLEGYTVQTTKIQYGFNSFTTKSESQVLVPQSIEIYELLEEK